MSRAGGKKGSNSALRGPMTMREESIGKKQFNVNAKTMCKIDHLKYLAAEPPFPSLGAFFGERLAATSEALGLRDTSLFVCERCESILQPGHNCSVRIEKNKSRGRRGRKKSNPTTQNNIVYRCHFCSHRNVMRGTPKGYVKEICPPKPKPTRTLKKTIENCPSSGNASTTTENKMVDPDASLPLDGQNLETSAPATPLPTMCSLLDSKRRKKNRSTAKRVDEAQISSGAVDLEKSTLASSKKRKKSWTSLKEIAESSGQDIGKKLTDLTIPFFI